jgi:hypothetical protein
MALQRCGEALKDRGLNGKVLVTGQDGGGGRQRIAGRPDDDRLEAG